MPFTGVPKYIKKQNIFVPDYPYVNRTLNHATTRTFYYGLFKYSLIFGLGLAFYGTDREYMRDDLMNRPDLREMRIMVKDEYIPLKEKKVFEMLSGSYFGKPLYNEEPTGLYKKLVRYFFPELDYNPSPGHFLPPFDYTKDYQSENWSNHYHL
jgi:hypothetical protein